MGWRWAGDGIWRSSSAEYWFLAVPWRRAEYWFLAVPWRRTRGGHGTESPKDLEKH